MTSSYFTLEAIVRELGPELVGARFLEAYSVRANELRLRFDRGTLVAVLRPIDGALFLSTSEERRPRQNVRQFFESLAGAELADLTLAPADRRVELHFGDREIQLSYYGTPNAVLHAPDHDPEEFKRERESADRATASSMAADLLGKQYTRELLARGIAAEELVASIRRSRTAMIHRRGDRVLMALLLLESFGAESVELVDSVNEAVRAVIIERGRMARVGALRKRLLAALSAEEDRLRGALAEMRKGVENSDRAERYAAIGNALLMIASEIAPASEQALVMIEETPTTVKLEATRSAWENAAQYFERSKRARAAKEELRARTTTAKAELVRIGTLLASVREASDLRALEQLEPRVLAQAGVAAAAGNNDGATHFREFVVAGGLKVLVGKNAKQNDELTAHVAKKEDIWLHARGVPGSHVVLQCGKRPNVPKEAIEQAAEIAAYFSDARPQPLAPVSYTRRKYVRKPKGADPGAVFVEREEVIMVRPKMPNTTTPNAKK